MAFGFQGPISPDGDSSAKAGDRGMVDYALSRTYRILSADRNENIAACKICGATLKKATGFRVLVSGLVFRTPANCYVCLKCFAPIKDANETFPLFDPLPSWWKILERNTADYKEGPSTAALPRDEVDHMIKQREKRRTRTRGFWQLPYNWFRMNKHRQAVRFRLFFGYNTIESILFSKGDHMQSITAVQQIPVTATPVDAKGNPVSTTFPTPPAWSSSDSTILTVVAAADGLSAVVTAVGKLGTATVSVSGIPTGATATITGSAQLQVTAAQVASFVVAFGTPVTQTPPPPPPPPPPAA